MNPVEAKPSDPVSVHNLVLAPAPQSQEPAAVVGSSGVSVPKSSSQLP